jgi:membrane protease YdiL (CAAX protease family)
MRDFARRHPLATYLALAYAISWAWWIPLALGGAVVTPGGSVTHFPGLVGPALAAYLTTALSEGWSGIGQLTARLFLISRPRSRFWIYTLSPLVFLGFALVIAAWRGSLPEPAAFALYSGLPDTLSFPLVLLLVLLFNGFGEETGWRGFALERLQHRFGPLRGALLLGLICAGWHVPTFWTVEGYRTLGVPMLIGGFGLGILAGSVVLARVANRTAGSILAAALWHFSYNMTSATAASRGRIGAVTSTCVMIWATLLIVQEVRRPTVPSRVLTGAATQEALGGA